MTSLNIKDSDIPSLAGKVALVTGGASGIGLATAALFAAKGAKVHIVDRNAPIAEDVSKASTSTFHQCDITSWSPLLKVFGSIGHLDIVVANAGVSQEADYFADAFDEHGTLQEPRYAVLDVNMRATLNVVKLALHAFRTQWEGRTDGGGSLVITASATAYAPELSLPVYSASKLAQIGLIRALRPQLPLPMYGGSTINGVAPAATISALLPMNLAGPIMAAGLPVSQAHHAALAIAWSATARQTRQVEGYGRDPQEKVSSEGRWNGRVIMTLGESWQELEGPIADARQTWMGEYADRMTAFQQAITDSRDLGAASQTANGGAA